MARGHGSRGLALLTAALLRWQVAAELSPDNYTCLLPVRDGESLEESEIWQMLMVHLEGQWDHTVDRATKSASRVPSHTVHTGMDKAGVQHEGSEAGHEAHKAVRNPADFLRFVNREATEECTKAHGAMDTVGKVTRMGLDELNGRKLAEADGQGDVLNEGYVCLNHCDGRGGDCRTGFCGPKGVCCKFGGSESECAGTGCSDAYCCVARPTTAADLVRKKVHCHARPGQFCLSTVTSGYTESLTSVQLCLLQRTLLECPPGFWCPGGKSPPRACTNGFYCPLGTAKQAQCPASFFCPTPIMKKACPPGTFCPTQSFKPQGCTAGQYCPDGLAYPCPEGHFCPQFSPQPYPCAGLATCHEGAEIQDWSRLCLMVLPVFWFSWLMLVAAVPQWLSSEGGACAAVVTAAPAVALACAWCAKLDLLYALAPLPYLSVAFWFGAPLHGTALVLLTLSYALLCYGISVSSRIRSKTVQKACDLSVVVGASMAFVAGKQDAMALLFICNLLMAFEIFWSFLARRGCLQFRLAMLAAGFGGVALQLQLLTPLLPPRWMLAAFAALLLRELAFFLVPQGRLLLQRRKKGAAGSALNDTPFRPLIDSLSAESVDLRSSVSDIVTAACLTAGARASLAAHDISGGLSKAMDAEAWAPWLEYRRERDREHRRRSEGKHGVPYELGSVTYRVESGKRLLHELSLIVPGGSSVAVMGASGSGKTTLLSVLSGRCGDGRFAGSLAVDGEAKLPREMAEIRSLFGYVPQDDVMHTALTVTENCAFQAELRLVGGKPGHGAAKSSKVASLKERVAEVLQGLGLSHVADRLVADGLSGGQRKRVSIGMELVASPRVLFLDEPTTGLDSSTAHRIMELVLSQASKEQCTTFSTIHQPRWLTLSLFDMLILLAPGGYLCYAGPVTTMTAYFEEVLKVEFKDDENPADTIIDVCTFESARRMALGGEWKSPPQCLRAVLFPTPDAAQDEDEDGLSWQPAEFGRMLAALWSDFSTVHGQLLQRQLAAEAGEASVASSFSEASSLGTATSERPLVASFQLQQEVEAGLADPAHMCSSLGTEAKAKLEMLHWGSQVWIHVRRSLLVLSRELWPTVICNVLLLVLTMKVMTWAYPKLNFNHVFLHTALFLLLFGLAQSVAAQRLFGGAEREMALREASLSSPAQVLYTFVGKDLSSLLEILLSAATFAFIFCMDRHTYAYFGDVFETGFTLLYCLWGFNHLIAISFRPSTALVMGVVVTFMSFLCTGLRPTGQEVAGSLGGYGLLLLLASPMRWGLTLAVRWNMIRGGSYLSPLVIQTTDDFWTHERGFSLSGINCLSHSTVAECWRAGSGWASHGGQLVLLGLLFRFVAAVALLVLSTAHANGGQLPLGANTMTKSRILRDCLLLFLCFFTLLNLTLLGETH